MRHGAEPCARAGTARRSSPTDGSLKPQEPACARNASPPSSSWPSSRPSPEPSPPGDPHARPPPLPDAEEEALRLRCARTLRDQATGGCIAASSVPLAGSLLPLGPLFMVDALGRVGVGTATPARALDVAGVIRSQAGGVEFPDGSVQTTATLQGPAGPAGPPGPLEPPPLTTPTGTVEFVGVCGPDPIFEFTHLVQRSGGASFVLAFSRESDACSKNLFDAFSLMTVFPSVVVTVGDLEIALSSATIAGWGLETPPGLPPRETFAVDAQELTWTWSGPGGPDERDLALRPEHRLGSPSLGGANLTLVRPDLGPLPPGAFEVASARQDSARFELERLPDALTPSAIHAVTSGVLVGASELKLMLDDGGVDKEKVVTSINNLFLDVVELTADPTGVVTSSVEVNPGIWTIAFF